MKRIFNRVMLLPTLALFAFSPAYANDLTPITVADLYIKVQVNHDATAIKQLNDYLRPDRLRSGLSADYASYAELQGEDKAFPVEVAKNASELFPEASRTALLPPLEAVMSAVQQARRRSQCQVLSAEPMSKEDDELIVQVKFTCQVVKVNETWVNAVQRLGKSGYSVAQCRSELEALQKAYAGPVNSTYQSDFLLGREATDTAWRNDFAEEPIEEMFDEL